jgi:hypothetical protein
LGEEQAYRTQPTRKGLNNYFIENTGIPQKN